MVQVSEWLEKDLSKVVKQKIRVQGSDTNW